MLPRNAGIWHWLWHSLVESRCLHALLDLTHNSVLAHVTLYYTPLFMCLSPSSWMWAPWEQEPAAFLPSVPAGLLGHLRYSLNVYWMNSRKNAVQALTPEKKVPRRNKMIKLQSVFDKGMFLAALGDGKSVKLSLECVLGRFSEWDLITGVHPKRTNCLDST